MDLAEILLRVEDWRPSTRSQEGALADLLERERAEQLSPERGVHLGLAAQSRSVRVFVRNVTGDGELDRPGPAASVDQSTDGQAA